MNYQILQGDNRDTLKTLADDSVDAIITDPPYGIDFLGKSWDANTGAVETYQECLRVLKPGGHILAFSAARTYHHLAVTLEQAGFEIRDQIMWIYSSGFPKSQDIGKSIDRAAGKKDPNYGTNKSSMLYWSWTNEASVVTTAEGRSESTYVRCKICNKGLNGNTANDCDKNPCGLKYAYQTEDGRQWAGWGTQLKPAHEPIVLARKPLGKGNSIARNCQVHGVGALNIDATRVPYDDPAEAAADAAWRAKWGGNQTGGAPVFQGSTVKKKDNLKGLKAKQGAFSNHINAEKNVNEGLDASKDTTWEASQIGRFPSNVRGSIPLYQKYFYCPKVGRRERHIGFPVAKGMYEIAREHGYTLAYDDPNDTSVGYMVDTQGNKVPDLVLQKLVEQHGGGNNHPTVKPIELMKYLIRLITPEGGTVLDPFNGSGSTGCAAVELGHAYIGCELDPAYVEIAKKRIEAWYAATRDPAKDIFN